MMMMMMMMMSLTIQDVYFPKRDLLEVSASRVRYESKLNIQA